MKHQFIYQAQSPVVKLLQITDPHLFKEEQGELLGINTQASFAQVLQEIQQANTAFDLILATGDCAMRKPISSSVRTTSPRKELV